MKSQRVSSMHLHLMPVNRRTSISQKHTERVARYQQHGTIGQDIKNSAPEFVDSKVACLDAEISYHKEYLDGLSEVQVKTPDIDRDRKETIRTLKPFMEEYRACTLSRRGLTADISEEIRVCKKRKNQSDDTDEERLARLSRGYARSISMFTNHIAGVGPPKIDHNDFKQRVLDFYDGRVDFQDGVPQFSWCHLTGAWAKKKVVAAHLVPRSFTDDTVQLMFDSEENMTRESPKNALLFHKNIEEALDRSDITIVPIASGEDEPTRWKCVLINVSKRNDVVCGDHSSSLVRYRELDNKELQFRNENRPANRFLYFKFVIALTAARDRGRPNIVQDLGLDNPSTSFWPSPGEYVRKSLLTEFTRKISGLELPEQLINTTTFDDDQLTPSTSIAHAEIQAMIEVEEVIEKVGTIQTNPEEDSEDSSEDD